MRFAPRIGVGLVPFAIIRDVCVEVVFELFAVHEVSEEMTPADLCWPVQIGRAVTVKEFYQTRHPSGWVEKTERCSSVDSQRSGFAGSIRGRHVALHLF